MQIAGSGYAADNSIGAAVREKRGPQHDKKKGHGFRRALIQSALIRVNPRQ